MTSLPPHTFPGKGPCGHTVSKYMMTSMNNRQKVLTLLGSYQNTLRFNKYHSSCITFAGVAIRIIYNSMGYRSNDQKDNGPSFKS